jgi:predicted transcriptional regulator
MRREAKRSRMELYATILEVVTRYPEGLGITRLSYGVGVPVDRLRVMVDALCSYGLMGKLAEEGGSLYGITPRGLEFLETFWKMKGFLATFGEKS